MNNIILTDILRTFSVEEMNKFGEMVSSAFFNKKTSLIKLFAYIKNYYPDFKSAALKKETVYSNMFPHKKFSYGSMKNLIFDLQNLAERFIAEQEMSKNKFDFKKSLINSLHDRNLNSLSEKNLRELEKELSGNEMSEDEYFLKLYYTNKIKQRTIFESSKGNINLTDNIRNQFFENFFNSTKNLKKHYLLEALRAYNRLITNKNILNTDQIIKDCYFFISNTKEEDFDNISLKLEISFLKMNLGSISKDEFLQFKKLVLTDLYDMNAKRETTYAYSIYLLNYCRIKNISDKEFKVYAFEILKNLAENKNFESGTGYMNLVLMRNIVIISSELKEFQWCEKFLELYADQIHPEYRDNLMKFFFAHKNFYEGRFGKSLEFLSMLKADDIYNKNYIKELIVINYYELKYFDLLNEQLDAYKKFLTNNDRLPDSYKKQYLKFVNFMRELFKSATGKKTDLIHLENKVQNEKELIFKDWFIRKLKELKE